MSSGDSQNDPTSYWYDRNRYDTNSKIMLTAIISLSLVVVLVSLLHIYARCVLRRQARRRAALRQMRIIAAAHYQSTTEPLNRGLDPFVVASLPKFTFKLQGDAKDVESGAAECAVCLNSLEEGETARRLPNCGHTFHAECIDKWFASQSTCPICRTGAEPRPGLAVLPEPREGAIGVPVSIGPTAPHLECSASTEVAGGADGGSARINGSSSSRLSSFRRILSWDRSSKRIQHLGSEQEGCSSEDLERQ